MVVTGLFAFRLATMEARGVQVSDGEDEREARCTARDSSRDWAWIDRRGERERGSDGGKCGRQRMGGEEMRARESTSKKLCATKFAHNTVLIPITVHVESKAQGRNPREMISRHLQYYVDPLV
jgi:hypothetical protein